MSAEQFLDIFSAKWVEADSEELQVIVTRAMLLRAVAPCDPLQLFSFSLYDDDNKGYITKEDLERWRAAAAACCLLSNAVQGVCNAVQRRERGA